VRHMTPCSLSSRETVEKRFAWSFAGFMSFSGPGRTLSLLMLRMKVLTEIIVLHNRRHWKVEEIQNSLKWFEDYYFLFRLPLNFLSLSRSDTVLDQPSLCGSLETRHCDLYEGVVCLIPNRSDPPSHPSSAQVVAH
jgi:hypothetical protein